MSSQPSAIAKIALALGAGLAGSAVMLLSQKAEMAATGRKPSDTPAKAVETLTGITLYDDEAEARLSTAAHFAFGGALGLGLLLLDRVPGPARPPLFAAGAWGVGTGVLVALDLADPPTRWTAAQLATDIGHHAVYGLAAAGTHAAATRAVAEH